MLSDLPSLNFLYTFESAARHLSFKLAAEELHVTPSAVSKQIRQLEENLGYPLFHRLTRKLVLTDEGQQLMNVVRTALKLIADGLQMEEEDRTLKLSVPPSFAMKWFIPRLRSFQTLFPEIILDIDAEGKYVDLQEAGVDLAIRYGNESSHPTLEMTFMMKEALFPVCAPQLLAEGPPIREVADLQHYCFLHTPEKTRWVSWFATLGLPACQPKAEISFSRADLAVQAAVAGQGIMIARAALVRDDIKTERLIRLFDYPVEAEKSYYMLCLKDRAEKRKVVIFRTWLLEEVKQFQGSVVY